MIIFNNIEENRIRFSAEEHVEDVTVRVEGLYSPSDDSAAALFSDHFETINPSIIYFISHYGFLGYPFLKLIFEKEKEDIAEILIPVNHQWSLSNYFSNSELKKINKGGLGSLQEIFLNKDYGNGNDIPNVNTIVDLGFNCGWFAAFSADKAQRYIAVEADERLNPIGLLINKKNKNKIEICNRVFHDTNNEDITFHLNDPEHSAINSIWDKWGEGHKNEPTTKKTINLPEIIKRYNLDYIDLLKVDIEGAEEFLLKKPNLEIVLNKVGVLLIELHGEDNINAFNNNRDIKNYFDKLLLQDHGSQKTIKLTKKPTLNILKSINLPKKETNLLVLSATTKNIEFPTNKLEEAQNYGPPDWTDLTYKANKEYADIHGYDFKSVEAETKEGFHWPTWIKIPLIKKYLKDYDYVFWIDSDAIFCTNQSLEMFMGKNVGLTKCLTSKEDSKSFTITSSGAMLFKNSEFSFKVLKDLEEQAHKWADGAFLKENWHEQGFLDRLYVEPEIISTRNYESDFYNLINREAADLEKTFETENFKILPNKHQSGVDFIFHAAGDQTTKRKRLEEVWKRKY